MRSALGGDAPVGGATSSGGDRETKGPGKKRPRGGNDAAAITPWAPVAKSQKTKGADRDANGEFSTNRKGYTLCAGFNAGLCTGRPSNGGFCPADGTSKHQCTFCLDSHPRVKCPKAKAPVVGGKASGKGKKGKDKEK